MVDLAYFVVYVLFHRAVCRKHELTQYELEMAAQDLTSKKQQREELATGVSVHLTTWLNLEISTHPSYVWNGGLSGNIYLNQGSCHIKRMRKEYSGNNY